MISSWSFHFGSLMRSILLSSIISLKSSLFSWLENIFFRISILRSCPTLLSIGMIASVLNCWLHPANSFVQKFLTTSSSTASIISYLKSLSVRALMISKSVESGLSRSARNIILSTCSSFGFQLDQKNFLNISINHFASICLLSVDLISSGLKQKGNCSSVGSNMMTSFTLSFGIWGIISSIKSPCGSMSQTHLHCLRSSMTRELRNFDFHVPVFPTTYICLSLSSSCIHTGTVIDL